jgi:hypothetical protein
MPWDCFPVPDCVNPQYTELVKFQHAGGVLRIKAEDFVNTQEWIRQMDLYDLDVS